MVKKVISKPITKSKRAKQQEDAAVQTLILRQSYIPVETDAKLKKLLQSSGMKMNELLRGIIEEAAARLSQETPVLEIHKIEQEPEIEFYVQEFNDGWKNIFGAKSESDANSFLSNLDREAYPRALRLIRATLESVAIYEAVALEA